MNLETRCEDIRLLLSDIDGVMTDGGVVFDNEGVETKVFNIRDGLGIRLWQKAGHDFGIVTGRTSGIVQRRAVELDIELVRQGVKDKLPIVHQIIESLSLEPNQVAYIGDDLPDLSTVKFVGLGIAVADACAELIEAADHITATNGGRGAVREAIEMILKHQGRWPEMIETFQN